MQDILESIKFQWFWNRAKVKYFFKESLPWFIAWKIPRKVALFAFVRVYSTLDSFSSDYERAYHNWDSGRGR